MAFYPTPFGHVEVRIDPRDPRPKWFQIRQLAKRSAAR
jgi:hypothetical protein